MAKTSPIATANLVVVLDLLSPSQIATLAYGSFALFGDLHIRAQPKPLDRVVSKQLRTVNADALALNNELMHLAHRDPVKALAVAMYLRGTTRTLGASDLAERIEIAVEGRSK